MKGHCTCGAVEFELRAEPMITHCCHCTWCQRESGSAFIINAYLETKYVALTKGEVMMETLPTKSGKGQQVCRCTECRTTLWSHFAGSGKRFAFVRTGTLEAPWLYEPDVHIFTSTKLPWVYMPAGSIYFDGFYDPKELWSDQALDRFVTTKLETA